MSDQHLRRAETGPSASAWEHQDPRTLPARAWAPLPVSVSEARARRRTRPGGRRPAVEQSSLLGFGPSLEVEVRTALQAWRRQVADQEGLRPEKVLADATLEHVLARMPTRDRELRAVRGVGPRTMDAHGGAILRIVRRHVAGASSST